MIRSVVLTLTILTAAPAHAAEKPVPNARAIFDQVSALIRDNYVDEDVGEDQLWTYALDGLVDHLLKTGDEPINDLLDPDALAALQEGVKGTVTGVGVAIEAVEDLKVVREVLPGGPAAKTRIQPGDRILAIDGQDVAAFPLERVVPMIRGKDGTSVELLMQRGTEEWTETITRGQVQVESVQGVLHEGVAYIRIAGFSQDTPKRLDAVLAAMKKGNAKALVLDLRGSPGGLFDAALEVADRFLPSGETIVSLRRRDGRDELHRAKTASAIRMPIAVLVGHHTASSAEILAAALRENGHATLIGETTFGKGTVERIFELDNGYALRLTIARFYSPNGNNWQGKGIEPDFVIPSPEKEKWHAHSTPLQLDFSADPQLKAAFALLRLK